LFGWFFLEIEFSVLFILSTNKKTSKNCSYFRIN
jgi:hypothetical protein